MAGNSSCSSSGPVAHPPAHALEPLLLQELVEAAANMYDVCDGDLFRFQILNGSLWVHHVTERRGGWYPAVLGPGEGAGRAGQPCLVWES